MTLTELHPFTGADAANAAKQILPTSMNTAKLREELSAAVRRQSFFSAQTLLADLLDGYKEKVASILNPETEQRADRVTDENPEGNVTTGLNPTYARAEIKELLDSLGYAPEADEAGTLKDLSSDARINLVIATNTELAQGAGRFIQMNDADVIDEFPAQELVRFEPRHKQRDWEARWLAAAAESGDTDAADCLNSNGRMVALKASPIWDSLGDGAGGYEDTLGNPYPPFAFNSGMWVQSVSRSDAEELGLMDAGDKVEAHPLDLTNLFGAS
jgi:hypothetical protein